MTIGVFFGSFNPIHLGHVAIAERFLQEKNIDEVWLSVSPHNPLKSEDELLATHLRVEMAEIAVEENERIRITDFEKDLPQPSYTYEALLELKRRYPQHRFILLIGGDNCVLFEKWRNFDKILDEFEVWAYPRDILELRSELSKVMTIIEAPLLDIAATDIRLALEAGKLPRGIDPRVLDFIVKKKLYKE